MTSKLATLTAAAALALAPAVAFGQSPAPETTTPPAASPVQPDAGNPQAPASEMPATTPTPDAMPSAPADAMPSTPAPADSAAAPAPATPKFVSAQSSGQWLGSDLTGTVVVTATDEKLGSISDLVIERDGTVVAAVIDVGGFLGIGAKPVAVSFDSLTPTATDDGQKVVVSLTKEEVNAAPEFKTLEQTRTETTDARPATTN